MKILISIPGFFYFIFLYFNYLDFRYILGSFYVLMYLKIEYFYWYIIVLRYEDPITSYRNFFIVLIV